MDKKQFDENKNFFKQIKTIKLFKIQEICSTAFVFSRAKRYVARMFQDFLHEKCGLPFGFQVMNKLFKVNEILLTDRQENKIYTIDLPNAQEHLETCLALSPDQILSIELQDLAVNDAGDFIALIFKMQYRENSKTNDLYKVIYAPKIEKTSEFREVPSGSIMNSHRRQASGAIKDMITGVTGYMSSRFKDHQRSQTQVFDERKVSQQQVVA